MHSVLFVFKSHGMFYQIKTSKATRVTFTSAVIHDVGTLTRLFLRPIIRTFRPNWQSFKVGYESHSPSQLPSQMFLFLCYD